MTDTTSVAILIQLGTGISAHVATRSPRRTSSHVNVAVSGPSQVNGTTSSAGTGVYRDSPDGPRRDGGLSVSGWDGGPLAAMRGAAAEYARKSKPHPAVCCALRIVVHTMRTTTTPPVASASGTHHSISDAARRTDPDALLRIQPIISRCELADT